MKYKDYLKATQKVLRQSQKEMGQYNVVVCGRKFIAHPKVFSPKYFNDTEIFASNLPVQKGDSLLEIGCGIGAVCITAIYRGAKKALGTDINSFAKDIAKKNVLKHSFKKQIEIRRGDLFKVIGSKEKFNVIFWNVPFGLVKKSNLTILERAVYDTEYKKIAEYIKKAPGHLTPNGRLYVGFSTTLGKYHLLKKFVREADCKLQLVFKAKSEEIYPVQFEIFQVIS